MDYAPDYQSRVGKFDPPFLRSFGQDFKIGPVSV